MINYLQISYEIADKLKSIFASGAIAKDSNHCKTSTHRKQDLNFHRTCNLILSNDDAQL